MSEAASITVAVRIRPPTPWEADRLPGYTELHDSAAFMGDGHLTTPRKLTTGKNLRQIVRVMDDQVLVFDPPDEDAARAFQQKGYLPPGSKRFKDQRYKFDRVFDEKATQHDVFAHTTKLLLDGIFNGYNATVFAYGATGCGKTHTISGTASDQGVIYRTMNELFARIEDHKDDQIVELTVTYLEIYNENIRDLLSDVNVTAPKGGLQLREDKDNRVTVANLTELHPTSAEEVQSIVQAGNARRTQSPTHANETSSRSHAVLQVNVTQSPRTANTIEARLSATLSIIDLAGSERASATKNMGERMIEGANINKSLLALGNCINALCESGGRTRHIPYRNSKLTRLLKFSLGGNCKTVMIVCVAPTSAHYDDTQNTLKYANRAKEIKTKISKNLINVDRHVAQYVEAIQRLNGEVAELKAKLAGKISAESDLEKRRKADARVEAERAKADMCAKAEQSRPVIVDGASCEATRDAADIILRAIRPRFTQIEAQATQEPLSLDLLAERDYLAALAAPYQSLLSSDTTRANLQRSENTRSMLEAILRAASERRSDRLEETMVEDLRTTASLQRAETEAARLLAREQALQAALNQQAETMAQLIAVLGQCTATMKKCTEVKADAGEMDGICVRLDNTANASHQTILSTLSRGVSVPSATQIMALPLPLGSFTPGILSSPSRPPQSVKTGRRSSLLRESTLGSPGRRVLGTRSPRKSLSFRQSVSQSGARLSQSLLRKAGEKKSLRWRDEAGEGEIDDAGLGGSIQEASSGLKVSPSESEWEDEKTDDSIPLTEDKSAPIPARRLRSSRLDPSYLKSKRLSSLGEEDENDENKLGVAFPSKSSHAAAPLGERGNLPFPDDASDESITYQATVAKLRARFSPPPKSRPPPMSVSKNQRVSSIGPIRSQKPRRRSSLIPQPSPSETASKGSLGGAKRVQVNAFDADASIRRSPMKKAGRRISVGMGIRPSMGASTSTRGPFKTVGHKPSLSSSLSLLSVEGNSSIDALSLRGKVAWR